MANLGINGVEHILRGRYKLKIYIISLDILSTIIYFILTGILLSTKQLNTYQTCYSTEYFIINQAFYPTRYIILPGILSHQAYYLTKLVISSGLLFHQACHLTWHFITHHVFYPIGYIIIYQAAHYLLDTSFYQTSYHLLEILSY